jgi:hypothetical protein
LLSIQRQRLCAFWMWRHASFVQRTIFASRPVCPTTVDSELSPDAVPLSERNAIGELEEGCH